MNLLNKPKCCFKKNIDVTSIIKGLKDSKDFIEELNTTILRFF